MRFPLTEVEILVLSQSMSCRLIENLDKFPQPPADPASLEAGITTFKLRSSEAASAQSAAKVATESKREALNALVSLMKSGLRYAEIITNWDDVSLKALGWSAPRPKKPKPASGQPGTLRVEEIDEGSLSLCWNAPPGRRTGAHVCDSAASEYRKPLAGSGQCPGDNHNTDGSADGHDSEVSSGSDEQEPFESGQQQRHGKIIKVDKTPPSKSLREQGLLFNSL